MGFIGPLGKFFLKFNWLDFEELVTSNNLLYLNQPQSITILDESNEPVVELVILIQGGCTRLALVSLS